MGLAARNLSEQESERERERERDGTEAAMVMPQSRFERVVLCDMLPGPTVAGYPSYIYPPNAGQTTKTYSYWLVDLGHVGLGAGELGPCWCFPFARLRRPGPEIRSHRRPWGSRIPQHGSGQNQVWVFDFTKATGTGRRENKSQYWAQRRCYWGFGFSGTLYQRMSSE